jgi:hypothetical protein
MRPLRVAFLLDAPGVPEPWQRLAVERIEKNDLLHFAGYATVGLAGNRAATSTAFSLLSELEIRVLLPRSQRATAPVSVNHLESLDADIVINGSLSPLDSGRLARFRHGEWRFNFSDERDGGTDWFGYRPVMQQAAYTHLVLGARDASGRSGAVASARFSIKPSGAVNNRFVKERAVSLLLRELRRLALTGERGADARPWPKPAPPPTTAETAGYSASLVRTLVRRAVKSVRERFGWESDLWTLYTGDGSIGNFDPGGAREIALDLKDIRADPFLFSHDGALYVFYEAYAFGDRVAHIAVGLLEDGKLTPLGSVLKRSYHLSYPYVFRDGADIFMLPETHAAQRIEVWRCTDFPHSWELHATALEGVSAADSMLYRHEGAWWLFTNISEYRDFQDHCSELHIFKTDGPTLRNMVPHRLNPVVIGSDTARNGGRITESAGRLFRPSQCNAHGIYGFGLNIMRIEELNLNSYREVCIRTIRPDFRSGLTGCHHFDCHDGAFVVDVRLRA